MGGPRREHRTNTSPFPALRECVWTFLVLFPRCKEQIGRRVQLVGFEMGWGGETSFRATASDGKAGEYSSRVVQVGRLFPTKKLVTVRRRVLTVRARDKQTQVRWFTAETLSASASQGHLFCLSLSLSISRFALLYLLGLLLRRKNGFAVAVAVAVRCHLSLPVVVR
jgi:hypothetical protein